MNKVLLLIFFVVGSSLVYAQNGVQNQNPNYRQSKEQYERIADSINSLQHTTVDRTYKAIDYLADRAEAREQRRQDRHELRMQRARWGYSNWNVGWYPSVGWGYNYGYGYRRYGMRPVIYTRF